jgi:hypothetical protein
MKKKATIWWGTFNLEQQKPRFWEIGSLLLGIEKKASEWRVISHSGDDPEKSAIRVGSEESPKFPKEIMPFKRFIHSETTATTTVTLTPVLADRSQVSHADTPFFLPPNEHITIYVTSPIWVRIETGSPKHPLLEIPTIRQSDTWHGTTTQEGELCYASRTFCRTNLNELPVRSNRVITPVIIYNNAKHAVMIDRLCLPLPHLSIYVAPNGSLWTEEIIFKNEPNQKNTIKQGKGHPHIAPDAALITQPRVQLKAANLITMFYSLLVE